MRETRGREDSASGGRGNASPRTPRGSSADTVGDHAETASPRHGSPEVAIAEAAKGGYRCPGCGVVFAEQAGLRDHFIGGESCMQLARATHMEVAEYDARHCSDCGLLLGSEMFYGGSKGWLCRRCVPRMTKAEAAEECLSDIAASAIGNAPGDRGGDNVAAESGRILQPRGVRGDASPRPSETSSPSSFTSSESSS